MSDPWALPGYDVQCLLGFGSDGEVWRAVQESSGDVVALKRLRPGATLDLDALRRQGALLDRLESPHVLRLREVVTSGGTAVLVLDHAGGGSLTGVLARRGDVGPGEAVGVGVALGQALAAAHALGLVHGDLGPASVLLTDDGRPLLAGLGLPRPADSDPADGGAYRDPSVPPGAAAGPAEDVWGLAAVLHHLLAGCPPQDGGSFDGESGGGRVPLALLAPTVPRSVVDAVEAGLAREPAQRPSAAAFAALLRRSHLVVPLALQERQRAGRVPAVARAGAGVGAAAGPAATEEADDPRQVGDPQQVGGRLGRVRRMAHRGLPARRALVPMVAAAVLLCAAAVGWLSARGPTAEAPTLVAGPAAPAAAPPASPAASVPGPSVPGPSAPARTDPPSRSSWAGIVDGLDARRSAAFATGDGRLLSEVYVAGSAAGAVDAAVVTRLAEQGWHAVGVRHHVLRVAVVGGPPPRTRLRVTDELSSARVLDAAGQLVASSPPRSAASYLVEVRRTPRGWRLASVARAGTASG